MEEREGFEQSSSNVGFPGGNINQPKKSNKKWILIVVFFILLIGGITFFIIKGAGSSVEEEFPTPEETPFITEPTPLENSSPSPTPQTVDKTKIKIQALNGTGISGEAASLQSQLKALGYTNITVGNADSEKETATAITFSNSVASSVADEITAKLKEIYATVSTSTSRSLTSFDIQIVIGLKKGATPKPAATSSATTAATSAPTTAPTTGN